MSCFVHKKPIHKGRILKYFFNYLIIANSSLNFEFINFIQSKHYKSQNFLFCFFNQSRYMPKCVVNSLKKFLLSGIFKPFTVSANRIMLYF